MKRMLPVLLVVPVFLVTSCHGGEDSSPWTRVFTDEADYVYFGTLASVSDGGFLIVMQTDYEDGNDVRQMRLIKTDRNGHELWNKSIDEYHGARNILSAFETSDEGFIIFAIFREERQESLVIIKVDKKGNHLWEKIIGPNGDMPPFPALTRIPDDSFIITWVSTAENGIRVIEIDTGGNVLLDSTLDVSIDDPACMDYVIENMADGGFVIACTKFNEEDLSDIHVISLDEDSRELWSRSCGGAATAESPGHVIETTDGGIAIVGSVSPSMEPRVDSNIYIVRLEADGTLLWERTYGSDNWVESVYSAIETEDGGFVFAGERYTYMPGSQKAYLLRVDWLGRDVWSRTFVAYDVQYWSTARLVLSASGGGFIITGDVSRLLPDGIGTDIFLMKLDSDGNYDPLQ